MMPYHYHYRKNAIRTLTTCHCCVIMICVGSGILFSTDNIEGKTASFKTPVTALVTTPTSSLPACRQRVALPLHAIIETGINNMQHNRSFLKRQQRQQQARRRRQSSSPLAMYDGNDTSSNEERRESSNNKKYLRWKTEQADGRYDVLHLQTAVTRFVKSTAPSTPTVFSRSGNDSIAVDLHAQIHIGDADFYTYYNSISGQYNAGVLFELLLDDALLDIVGFTTTTPGTSPKKSAVLVHKRCVNAPIQASNQDRQVAESYGWVCQADILQYHRNENWYHADFTREEFIQQLDANAATSDQQQRQQRGKIQSSKSNIPLWKLATQQQQQTGPAVEAATALFVGPPVLSPNGTTKRRRIFTNLFLPGNLLAVLLRSVLWLTVPSPELSIFLLDWSSKWFLTTSRSSSSSNNNSGRRSSTLLNGQVSDVAWPVLRAITQLQWNAIRKLVFGQVVVSGHNNVVAASLSSSAAAENDNTALLIQQRNDRALEILQSHVQEKKTSNDSAATSFALLYGCNHCPDLHSKLVDEFGYKAIQTDWRTVYSVNLSSSSSADNNTTKTNTDGTDSSSMVGSSSTILVLLFYLAVGGSDWFATIQEVGESFGRQQTDLAVVTVALYLLRHVIMYVGLSKLLLDFCVVDTTAKDKF